MICPLCGEQADAFAAPGETNTIEGYEYMCHIGSAAGTDLDGYEVIHL